MAFDRKSIEVALAAVELVEKFTSHVDVLCNMIDNQMMVNNEDFKKDPSKIYSDAYYSTIYYGDQEIKAKAIALLAIENETWLPECDKKLIGSDR